MILQLHKQFGHVDFYDKTHVYINRNTGEQLTSVTTFLKTYQQAFNLEYMSKKKAMDYKTTQQNVKNHWKKIGLQGSSRGTLVHNYLENKANNKTFPLKYDLPYEMNYEEKTYYDWSIRDLIQMADNFIDDNRHFVPIKPELIVCNEKIAGQIDLLAYDTLKEEYVLIDYKTDKKFERVSHYNKKFKRPLTKFQDCEFNKYSLQLSCYNYLLKPVVDIKSMYVVWFNNRNYNYEIIEVEYLKEVEDLIK